jgi:hypothetical protein
MIFDFGLLFNYAFHFFIFHHLDHDFFNHVSLGSKQMIKGNWVLNTLANKRPSSKANLMVNDSHGVFVVYHAMTNP